MAADIPDDDDTPISDFKPKRPPPRPSTEPKLPRLTPIQGLIKKNDATPPANSTPPPAPIPTEPPLLDDMQHKLQEELKRTAQARLEADIAAQRGVAKNKDLQETIAQLSRQIDRLRNAPAVIDYSEEVARLKNEIADLKEPKSTIDNTEELERLNGEIADLREQKSAYIRLVSKFVITVLILFCGIGVTGFYAWKWHPVTAAAVVETAPTVPEPSTVPTITETPTDNSPTIPKKKKKLIIIDATEHKDEFHVITDEPTPHN